MPFGSGVAVGPADVAGDRGRRGRRRGSRPSPRRCPRQRTAAAHTAPERWWRRGLPLLRAPQPPAGIATGPIARPREVPCPPAASPSRPLHPLSVLVLAPRAQHPAKPWATLFFDGFSRLIMGWAILMRPSSATVLAALRSGIVVDPGRGGRDGAVRRGRRPRNLHGRTQPDHAEGRPIRRSFTGKSGPVPLAVRAAEASDADFLTEVLVSAAFWRPEGPSGSVTEVLSQPQLAHDVAGWPRPEDLGIIALDGQQPVGAAWVRLLPERLWLRLRGGRHTQAVHGCRRHTCPAPRSRPTRPPAGRSSRTEIAQLQ